MKPSASRSRLMPRLVCEHLGCPLLRLRFGLLQPRQVAPDTGGMRAERQAVQRAGGGYLDVTPWLCTPSTCMVMVGNLLAYRDGNHLTTKTA